MSFRAAAGAVVAVAGLLGCGGDRAARKARSGREMATVVLGQPFEQVYSVPNRTRDTLLVRLVSPSAGEVTHVDSVIPPDSVGRVIVRMKAGPPLGVLSTGIRVEFAGSRPPERYRLLRRVVAPVEIEPQEQIYFFTAKGEAAQRELTIVNHLERPLDIRGATSTHPAFRPTVKPIEPGRRYQLLITLDTTTGVGRYEGIVRVATNLPEYASLEVQAHAFIKGVVSTSIDTLDYARLDAHSLDREAIAERTVLVRKYRGTDFRVLHATTDVPFLAVTIEPQNEGETYLVHVRIAQAKAPKGRFSGMLRIATNDSTARELSLPIHGEIL